MIVRMLLGVADDDGGGSFASNVDHARERRELLLA